MAIRYQQKCCKCKQKYVPVSSWKQRYVMCYDCQKAELHQPIKNAKMKKMFDIPEEFYKKNAFLRNIKMSYLRFETLTDKQIEAFKKTVKDMKKEKKEKDKN